MLSANSQIDREVLPAARFRPQLIAGDHVPSEVDDPASARPPLIAQVPSFAV
ncbi:hypothetical protein [Ensifer adhaerens]